MLLQDCFFIQRNYTALYNRMAVLFIAKSTAILKFYYFPLRHISRIRSSLLTNNIYIVIYIKLGGDSYGDCKDF